jgi:hypothetical protein
MRLSGVMSAPRLQVTDDTAHLSYRGPFSSPLRAEPGLPAFPR